MKLKDILLTVAVVALLVSNAVILFKLGGSADSFGATTTLKNDFVVTGTITAQGGFVGTASTSIDGSLSVAGKISTNRLTFNGIEQAFVLATNTSCDYRFAATSTLISWGVYSDATTSEAERIVSIWRQTIDEGGFGYATGTGDTELGSTTISGGEQLSWDIGSTTSVFGDVEGTYFDPAAKALVGRLFGTNEALVVHQDSSNLDGSADNALHNIAGVCAFLAQEL